MTSPFHYEEAFSRNLGFVTEAEQQALRGKKVAIAGLGGVGGAHVLTLARLGITHFHIADFDKFEIQNFNRQFGAMTSTIGQPKIDVIERMAKDINPEITVTKFSGGVNDENLDAFLNGIDLFVDGLDFFVLDVRRKVFARCYERGIPAITAGPIGMGTAYITFLPGGMSFEDYFKLDGLPEVKQYVNFLMGLTPNAIHRRYTVDASRIRLQDRKGPSTVMACNLCAGMVGIEALKILLGRGKVYAAPYRQLFDGYLGEFQRGKIFWPLHRLKLRFAYKMVAAKLAS